MRMILVLMLASAAQVAACSCSPIDICKIVQQPIVFIGEVVEGGVASWENPWYSHSTTVKLRVKENLRGLVPGTQFFDLATSQPNGMCAPNVFHRGRTYLVIPHFLNGKYWEAGCAGDRDVQAFADEVDYIRKYFGGKLQFAMRIYVGSGDNTDQGAAVPGAMIATTSKGKSYSTVTRDNGRAWLTLPGPGSFKLTATFPPYRAATVSAQLPENGCAEAVLSFASGNTVSGRVKGSGRVGLIRLDLPPDREGRPQMLETDARGSNGKFQFTNVPVGRYLLKFNPDGPGIDFWRKESRESTYFPGTSDRAHAKIIEFSSTDVAMAGMDLAAGQSVTLRDIRVMAKYRDGRLMSTARFRATAVANRPGTEDAFVSGLIDERTPEFQHVRLPVNRRIRIELWDEFRPWLKRYVAEFSPGGTPIEHTFITELQ